MIGIIDYGSGNLKSVSNAFHYLGQDAAICKNANDLEGIDKIVLPGVGSSKDAMEGLVRSGFVTPLSRHIQDGKPFLGICLGLQLLFSYSEEGGGCDCLNIIQGKVKLFSAASGLKIPQIGWNTVKVCDKACPLFSGIDDETYFYFVHSYYCQADVEGLTSGKTEYGVWYTSVLWKDNIFAVQFHPEKSQKNGLKLLENFVRI